MANGNSHGKVFRVVVGVNFTEEASDAIFESVQLARLVPTIDLHFVHVVELPNDIRDPDVFDAINERLGRVMIRLERYVRDALFSFSGNEAWGCDVAFHVRVGLPARELHQLAADMDAEMIIVGADRSTFLRKLFQRSTVEQLMREASIPVVVAHARRWNKLTAGPEPTRHAVAEHPARSGLSSYSYMDFGEPRRDSHLSGMTLL
jgi:nucleotide-binding universal stress UspA family protein